MYTYIPICSIASYTFIHVSLSYVYIYIYVYTSVYVVSSLPLSFIQSYVYIYMLLFSARFLRVLNVCDSTHLMYRSSIHLCIYTLYLRAISQLCIYISYMLCYDLFINILVRTLRVFDQRVDFVFFVFISM